MKYTKKYAKEVPDLPGRDPGGRKMKEVDKMTKYRIDIYAGPFVYDSLVSREYKHFSCVDDAKIYAYGKIQGTRYYFDILEVRE